MPEMRKALHEQPKLCDHILEGVTHSSVPLRIASSSVPNAGSGLFVVNDVAAGGEIFRSQPLLVVCEGNDLRVCDYCFYNPGSSLHPDGRFSFDGKDSVTLSACTGCKNVEYCSKVSQGLQYTVYIRIHFSLTAPSFSGMPSQGMAVLPQARVLYREGTP